MESFVTVEDIKPGDRVQLETDEWVTVTSVGRGMYAGSVNAGWNLPKSAGRKFPISLRDTLVLSDACHGARSRQGTRAEARAASGFIP